jgi:hypothetical protein
MAASFRAVHCGCLHPATVRDGYKPKGMLHRTRAPVRSVILMIEGSGVVPTGD